MGGTAVTPADSSPFPKCFHGLRGLGQTCSSFSSFIGGQVRERFISQLFPSLEKNRTKGKRIQMSFSMKWQTSAAAPPASCTGCHAGSCPEQPKHAGRTLGFLGAVRPVGGIASQVAVKLHLYRREGNFFFFSFPQAGRSFDSKQVFVLKVI